MTTPLNFGRDVQGFNAFAPATSDIKYSATITNGNETHISVPQSATKWIVVFSYQPGTNVWVDLTGATAAIPVGATLAATTAELNPASRTINALNNSGTASKVSMITDNATADVGVAF